MSYSEASEYHFQRYLEELLGLTPRSEPAETIHIRRLDGQLEAVELPRMITIAEFNKLYRRNNDGTYTRVLQ